MPTLKVFRPLNTEENGNETWPTAKTQTNFPKQRQSSPPPVVEYVHIFKVDVKP